MVKLSSKLPKEHERNGLEPQSRKLLENYQSQDTVVIVAILRTKDFQSTEDYERVPRVEVVAVEVALDATEDEALRDWLTQLHDTRVAHVKQPLDLPDEDDEPREPLMLEAGDIVDAELVDEPAGVTA